MSRRFVKSYSDPEFIRLLYDMDQDRVYHNLKPAFTRPAYAYTKSEVGGIGNEVSNV